MDSLLLPSQLLLISFQEVWQTDTEASARGPRICCQFRQLQGTKEGMSKPEHSPAIVPPTPEHCEFYWVPQPTVCSNNLRVFSRHTGLQYAERIGVSMGMERTMSTDMFVLQLIKKLSATPQLQAQNDLHHPAGPIDQQAALQANKATFFFQLVRRQSGRDAVAESVCC